jgi:hypothetical protein
LSEIARREGGLTSDQGKLILELRKQWLARAQEDLQQPYFLRGERMVLAGGIAEVFCYRLSKAAGVRVASVRLTANAPGPLDGFAKRVSGGWIVSEPIPQAIPIYYLRGQCETVGEIWGEKDDGSIEKFLYEHWLESLDKRCPIKRDAYNFPAVPPGAALEAARWNSAERLLGHAFRQLLYVSHAHNSNALVDLEGRLWLIDHERIVYRSNFEDIENLHALVRQSPTVMMACRKVGSITPSDIETALIGIPARFWDKPSIAKRKTGAVTTDPPRAADYFIGRLEAWQKYFPKLEREAETE